MKALIGITAITSVVCFVLAIVLQKDWTEALAWFCVAMYNTRDFINNLINPK